MVLVPLFVRIGCGCVTLSLRKISLVMEKQDAEELK